VIFGRSLVSRLIAVAAIWTAVLLVAGAVGLTSLYRSSVFRAVDDQLGGAVSSLIENVYEDESGVVFVTPPALDPRYSQTYSGRYWQVFYIDETDDRVVSFNNNDGRSRSLFGRSIELDPVLISNARARLGERMTGGGEGPEGQKLRVMAIGVRLPPFNDLILITAAADRAPADRDVRAFALAASWTLLAFAIGLLAAVFVQVRWGLAPLFAMRDAVTEVREGERERLDEAAPSELVPLARELNALIDHNRDVVERARAHVGNLAHALKTPISIILNESRAQSGAFADIVRRQTEKMQIQVEHHIKRATAATRGQSHRSRADVRAVIEDLARTLPRMYPERAIDLEVSAARDLQFRGERQDLEEMIGNLLDNAFKWARGKVRIASAPAEAPGGLSVVVDDDGSGLAPEQRSEVIARGIRLDEATPGSGLGLAIVHDLARVYGGRLELGESPLGGLRAALSLPAAAPRRAAAR
jgi:signal transduction histidine kinase